MIEKHSWYNQDNQEINEWDRNEVIDVGAQLTNQPEIRLNST